MTVHLSTLRTSSVLRAVGAAALAASLAGAVLAAPPGASARADVSPPSGEAPEPGAEVGSVPAVAWQGCRDSVPGAPKALQCATYQVPLDYRNPAAGTATIALDRLPATGPDRIGSLFLNPGGPGGSGVDFVAGVGGSPTFKALREHFDLVGFDPRGTNRSTPGIACEAPAKTVRRLDAAQGAPKVTRASVRRALRTGAAYAESCRSASGDLVDLTGTEYAVRDLDRLRAAVGDPKLSYLGFSYGTFLGTVYADLYPSRVRAVTLDGSVDPQQYGDDFLALLKLNAKASERSTDAFLAWCSRRAQACGFGAGDAEGAVDALIRRLDRKPLVSGQGKRRAVTNGYTVAELLYLQTGSGRGAWKDTGQLLAGIAAGRQTISNADLIGAGGATNIAIECTDSAGGVAPAGFKAYADKIERIAPRLGPALVLGPPIYDGANGATCARWPNLDPPSDWRGDDHAQGSAPILVVGSQGDPSTPYPGAVALADTLDNAVLLTEKSGPSSTHTSYFYNACIRRHVDAYLVGLGLPAEGTTCREEQ
ncbi:alpha/beta hydrolase [Nocardioides anomalus]|uniref:Alpha/beta hydrolase n=1 Tax=Nocardioides anomalus TaxID=2712223 RepID=A0A6G6W9E7_9ACTN|nr:alpha/beta hydrolase [Nocardioides anomalus]QIG41846.1 alpha/beta hydrolase [Nocardioides anomalus]